LLTEYIVCTGQDVESVRLPKAPSWKLSLSMKMDGREAQLPGIDEGTGVEEDTDNLHVVALRCDMEVVEPLSSVAFASAPSVRSLVVFATLKSLELRWFSAAPLESVCAAMKGQVVRRIDYRILQRCAAGAVAVFDGHGPSRVAKESRRRSRSALRKRRLVTSTA
jgi:hypothetical protein